MFVAKSLATSSSPFQIAIAKGEVASLRSPWNPSSTKPVQNFSIVSAPALSSRSVSFKSPRYAALWRSGILSSLSSLSFFWREKIHTLNTFFNQWKNTKTTDEQYNFKFRLDEGYYRCSQWSIYLLKHIFTITSNSFLRIIYLFVLTVDSSWIWTMDLSLFSKRLSSNFFKMVES